jgi:hypothetical protein
MSWVITGSEKTPVDPQFGSVSLLLHGNGTNGSTTITDNSPTPKTVTPSNGAVISTAQSKFGGSSLLLPSAGISSFTSASKIVVTNSTDFDFGSGDFTIEMWYYPIAQSQYSGIIHRDGADFPWTLYHATSANSGNPMTQFGSLTAWLSAEMTFGAIANNQWHHLAVTRASTVFRTFTNGALVTTDSSWNGAIANSTGNLVIGTNGMGESSGDSYRLQAHIDDLRITKGVARYTANFTPPTAPFPDI